MLLALLRFRKKPQLALLPSAAVMTSRADQIAAMVAEGLSDPKIAERLGLSVATILRHRQATGLRRPSAWAEIDARLRQMIEIDGLSAAAAARLLGRDRAVISVRVRKLGLKRSVPTPMPASDRPPEDRNRPAMRAGDPISWAALDAAARWRPAP